MLILDLAPELRMHVAAAIRDHVRRLRRDRVPIPPELRQLAEALIAACPARSSQEQTSSHPAPRAWQPAAGTPAEPFMLRAPDAAALLGFSPRTLARKVAAGEIPSVKDGRSRRYRPADLAAYVEAKATDDVRPAGTG